MGNLKNEREKVVEFLTASLRENFAARQVPLSDLLPVFITVDSSHPDSLKLVTALEAQFIRRDSTNRATYMKGFSSNDLSSFCRTLCILTEFCLRLKLQNDSVQFEFSTPVRCSSMSQVHRAQDVANYVYYKHSYAHNPVWPDTSKNDPLYDAVSIYVRDIAQLAIAPGPEYHFSLRHWHKMRALQSAM